MCLRRLGQSELQIITAVGVTAEIFIRKVTVRALYSLWKGCFGNDFQAQFLSRKEDELF